MNVAAHYRTLLRNTPAEAAGLESVGGVRERVHTAEAELKRIVAEHLDDKPELREIAATIAGNGEAALTALAGDDARALSRPETAAALEVIVRSDGSRPSFLIRDGVPDLSTSPVGAWNDAIAEAGEALRFAISCVGRIDDPAASQGFQGTGFLIAENLILTNRHVLQAVADPPAGGSGQWRFHPGVRIDFGHEFRARESVTPRALRSVLFAGKDRITAAIDHRKLDLALIELEPAAEAPRNILSLDIAPDWAQPAQMVFTIGYPANPGLSESLNLLELLFQSTFGCKRLAPGVIAAANANVHTWTAAHDCTTLGGNSGSVVLIATRGRVAAGLHYGGRRLEPRENWSHVLGRTLDETDGTSPRTLHRQLTERGVDLVDRRT